MNFRRKKRFEVEVATSSLNDIMFFLLLFFLIISTLANPSVIKILVPKAAAQKTVTKQQINLSINKNKEYYLNDKLITPIDLEKAIIAATKDKEDPSIVLRMDATLTIQELVDILAVGTKMKIRIVMATRALSS